MVVGTIALLQDPLPVHTLQRLLYKQSRDTDNTVLNTLIKLHSVILVPSDPQSGVRLLHPSFYDFIINPERCHSIPRLIVHAKEQHTLMAMACLQALNELQQDMCQIQDPSLLNSEVDDLAVKLNKHVPLHLQYASHHWGSHMAAGMISDSLLELLSIFCAQHLLHWLEICSLLGELRNALLCLGTVQNLLKVCALS